MSGDQAAKEVLAANQVDGDDFRHAINFYVKGVQGQLPRRPDGRA